MASSQYGLTPQGFVPKSVQEAQSDLQAQLSASLGNLDFSPSSVISQLTGIYASALADLWAMGAALYANSFPSGASGVAVDNILAINNMTRLAAAATVTNPTPATEADGMVLYGLVLYGEPGTVVPAGTQFSNGAASPAVFSLDAAVTIAAGSNARQMLYFSATPTQGSYQLQVTPPGGAALATGTIAYNAQPQTTQLLWSTAPTTGSFTLSLGNQALPSFSYNATTASIAAAIQQISAYANATVTGSVSGGALFLTFVNQAPIVSAAGSAAPNAVVQSVQSQIQAVSATDGTTPLADVTVTGTQQVMQVNFGAVSGLSQSTALQSVARIAVQQNSLATATTGVSVTPQISVLGAANQGTGTATCTQTGAITVTAGQLTTIVNPMAGLDSVTNQLDCLTGRATETDAEALARLRQAQGSSASGSLGAIVKRVLAVSGVTQCVGFENTTSAAQQVVAFAAAPTTGSWALSVAGETTSALAYNASAADVQAAIVALAGFEETSVTAVGTTGFAVNFVGARGGQGLSLMQVAQNSTQQPLSVYFGRPAHSIELVVQGGADADVAEAINAAAPAGIATYGSPTLRTVATTTAQSDQIVCESVSNVSVGQSVEAQGVPMGTTVAALSGTTLTLSAAATQTASNVPCAFDTAPTVTDAAGNSVVVAFSRPTEVVIWCVLTLKTDLYNVPGVSSSGPNPAATFNLSALSAIQATLIDVINSTPIGGTIIADGSGSLGGSFRTATPGILGYELLFDRVNPPVNTANLSLAANESPVAQTFSVTVQFS